MCLCICVIMQYILSDLLLAFSKSNFFLCFWRQTKYISVLVPINVSNSFNNCLWNLSLLIGHLRLPSNFQCFQQCHIILQMSFAQMWVFLWDRFPIANKSNGYMLFIFFLRFYLFIFRGRGKKEKWRERNIDMREKHDWLPLARSQLGTSLQPRGVPCLGIKPATFQFSGQCSVHWATAPRADRDCYILYRKTLSTLGGISASCENPTQGNYGYGRKLFFFVWDGAVLPLFNRSRSLCCHLNDGE